jgi:hypothetical protein
MKQLKKWYRADYQGEDVVTDLVHQNQNWDITKEFIPNSVFNNHISNKACVIGNGISREHFPLNSVINHMGGLLGREKLQTYGCNALHRQHAVDFLVVSGEQSGAVGEVVESGYANNNVVYASATHIQNNPGQFYMIPQDPGWNAGTMAAYLAAFDGHQTIYLLGFDCQDTDNYNYNMYAGTRGYQTARNAQADSEFFEVTMKQIFDVYNDVDFVRVTPTKYYWMPELWKYTTNLRQIDFREFIYEADL